MAHELSPKERPELLELHRHLREIIAELRKFIDTEEYNHLERAMQIHENVKGHRHYSVLSGRLDLENNLHSMYQTYRSLKGRLDDLIHGRLLDQAVYTIVRANIMATGLEFKLKRMRKG